MCYYLDMFINRETDYAIRIVRNLTHDSLSQIEHVAKKEDITLTMAHKVCRVLKQHGLVLSKSGVNGGYYLSRPLNEITLFDVYGVMNNVTDINLCLMDKQQCPFASTGVCKVHQELNRIQAVIHEELKSKPLSELA